jgi:hypothetical protein
MRFVHPYPGLKTGAIHSYKVGSAEADAFVHPYPGLKTGAIHSYKVGSAEAESCFLPVTPV